MNDEIKKLDALECENIDDKYYFCTPTNNDSKINFQVINTLNNGKDFHISEFTTLQLIDELYVEVNRFVYFLAKKFLEKFKMSLAKTSLLWGYNSNWLGKIVRGQRKTLLNPCTKNEKLSELETLLEQKLHWKAINSMILIKKFRVNKLNTLEFVDKLRIELGKITDVDIHTKELVALKVPKNLFYYILWGNERYIHDVIMAIEGKSSNPRPNFKFSLESLEIMIDNLKFFFGIWITRFKSIIDKYIIANPDLKVFQREQTLIKNKHYFSVIRNPKLINDPEVVYWYGFLNADGSIYIYCGNYIIYFSLKSADIERVYRFAEIVGYDKIRVNIRTVFRKFRGRIIETERAEIRFGSKVMYKDIMSQGYTSSHDENKQIPIFVSILIAIAKSEAKRDKIHWWYTYYGKLALSWLLGLYDGDGTLKDGKYGLINSGQKEFLDLIAITFDCKHRAKSKGEPIGFSSNESYYLYFGIDLFDAMLNSFELSMKRKRPCNWKFGSHVRTYLV